SGEPGLRRPEGDVQDLGDRRDGHPDVVMEHEDGALLRRQPSEATLELVAVRHEGGRITDRFGAQGRQLDLDRPATTPPGDVEAGGDGQSGKRGIEPIRVAQAREVTPGSDVRLLDRVPRELLVPEDEAGDGLQSRDGRADEHREGVMIAPPCPLDELPLVHRHPRDASIRPRSSLMASEGVKPFPAGRSREWAPLRSGLGRTGRAGWPASARLAREASLQTRVERKFAAAPGAAAPKVGTMAQEQAVSATSGGGPTGTGRQTGRQSRRAILTRVGLLVGILAIVFVVILPRVVDYGAVVAALSTLTPVQVSALVASTGLAYVAN